MGSVRRKVGFMLLLFYAVAIPAFLYFAFQSVDSTTVYAEEANNAVATLEIPSINLSAPVTPVSLVNHKFTVPDQIAGVFQANEHKTFIIGHSTTVFKNLHLVSYGDRISFSGKTYRISSIEILEKSTIDMNKILSSTDKDTIVIMTCFGEQISATDFTHRLIIAAVSTSL